jgi:hypothetical protein
MSVKVPPRSIAKFQVDGIGISKQNPSSGSMAYPQEKIEARNIEPGATFLMCDPEMDHGAPVTSVAGANLF